MPARAEQVNRSLAEADERVAGPAKRTEPDACGGRLTRAHAGSHRHASELRGGASETAKAGGRDEEEDHPTDQRDV